MRPRIALTLRRSDASRYDEPRDAISHDWMRLCEERGLAPLLVPPSYADPVGLVAALRPDALVLSNGESVGDPRHGEPGEWELRDEREAQLLEWALVRRIPVLAVCRGLQLVQVHFGGRVARDVEGHVAIHHDVELGAELSSAVGRPRACVNSFHRDAVLELATPLLPLATAPDGAIEAARHVALPLACVQWHPEREGNDRALDDWLFERFLRESIERSAA